VTIRLFFIPVLLMTTGLSAQNDSLLNKKLHGADYSRCGHNFVLIAGVNRSNFTSYELSFGRSYSAQYNALIPETFSQYAIGMDILTDKDKLFIAPKISCELDFFPIPLCLSRLNLLYYIDPNGEGSLKYRHEIGLSYRGYVNLNYSYTLNLTNKDFYRSGHGINLQLNIPLGKRKIDRVH